MYEPHTSLPGWRDFERSVALAFDGVAQESKAIFDVLVPLPTQAGISYGISCKMRETLAPIPPFVRQGKPVYLAGCKSPSGKG